MAQLSEKEMSFELIEVGYDIVITLKKMTLTRTKGMHALYVRLCV